MLKNLQNMSAYEVLSLIYHKINTNYKSCIIGVFLIGFISHLKIIVSFMGSEDFVTRGLYTDDNMALLGRYLLHYVSRISGIANVPLVIAIFSLVFIALSACLIVDIFQIENKVNCFLLGGMMAVFPTVTTTFLYMYTADAYMISLFLAVSSVWVTLKGKKYIPFAIVLLTSSLAIYQAYIAVAMTIIIILAIFDLIKTDNMVQYFKKYTSFLVMGVSSVLLYYGILKAILYFSDITLIDYKGISSVNLGDLLIYIKAAYIDILKVEFFKGAVTFSTLALVAVVGIALISGILFLYYVWLQKQKMNLLKISVLLLLFAVTPICLNASLVMGASDIHMLTRYAWVLLFCMPIILLENVMKETGNNKIINRASFAVLISVSFISMHFIYIAQCTYLATEMYMSKIEYKFGQILDDLIDLEIDVLDSNIILTDRVAVEVSDMGEDSITDMMIATGVEYMNVYYYNFFGIQTNFTIDANYRALEEVQEMEQFPNKGYIKELDGKIIIKI